MTEEERRAWIRTLAVLAVVAAARWAWAQRPGPATGPGVERDVAAAIDTVRALRSEEERRSRPLMAGETLDPNHADEIALDRLPGVGPATAAAIIAARDEAPFSTPDDLLAVRGIGPATLAKVLQHIRLPPGGPRRLPARGPDPGSNRGPGHASRLPAGRAPVTPLAPAGSARTTVDLNAAGTAELESLPGIGPALAARILRSRVESGRYTRVDDLLRVSGIGPVTLDRLRPLVTIR